jgi:hypothetical protein
MKEYNTENKIKIAFSNVKNDVLELKKEIKDIKLRLLEIEHKISLKREISKGNKGVLTTTLRQPYDNLTTTQQKIDFENINKNLKNLDSNLKKFILSLTNKEFLIFSTIYQQEEELKRPITYNEIGKKLNISQTYLRDCIMDLMIKDTPIIKQKSGSKVFLSIKKEFRSLNVGEKIIDFRRSFTNQTNLSDNFDI